MPHIRHIILPDTGADLLREEISLAFAAEGLTVSRVHPKELYDPASERSLERLAVHGPALLFSVNFQGLGPLRSALDILKARGGTAAVWCVDNPWNLLSGVRDPRWTGLPLFVTDHTFIPALKRHGAERVEHLPLAASFAHFAPDARRDAAFPPPARPSRFVFVGRSAFPGKKDFFAGLCLPPEPVAEAMQMLDRPVGAPTLPDFRWWEGRLYAEPPICWPGKKARLPALGAEECSLHRRAAFLATAAPFGLDVYGDAGWRELLPDGARLFPPVDYYARLPGIYRSAPFNLNITALQLPGGLTQRHFDVWTAGGLLLSDATPGLALFPEELTRPVALASPAHIATRAEQLEAAPGGKASLIADWQNLLRGGHTYAHRVRRILERIS